MSKVQFGKAYWLLLILAASRRDFECCVSAAVNALLYEVNDELHSVVMTLSLSNILNR